MNILHINIDLARSSTFISVREAQLHRKQNRLGKVNCESLCEKEGYMSTRYMTLFNEKSTYVHTFLCVTKMDTCPHVICVLGMRLYS